MKAIIQHTPLLLLAALFCAVSCVYPFEIETEGEGGARVIQGDILIGEYSTVRISESGPVSMPLSVEPVHADVSIVDDRGIAYTPQKFNSDGYIIDTRNADPDRLYKLRVETYDNKTYESPLQPVNKPAVIDSLSYIIDKERNWMDIAISVHSGNNSYFKWSFVEDWEYRALMEAKYIYIPPGITGFAFGYPTTDGPGTIVRATPENQTYRCWSHNESKNIMLFSTENQTDDRFVDLDFFTISRFDRRISYIYRIAVQVETLTKDAYKYWETVMNNSDFTGSLFSPNPSEVLGNITCLEDPSEMVYGYISVAQRSSSTLYVLDSVTGFFDDKEGYNTERKQVSDWFSAYRYEALRPYDGSDPWNLYSIEWVNKKCVDCTVFGGSNTRRPADWPY